MSVEHPSRFWGIVLNGHSESAPKSPPVTPVTCCGHGIHDVLDVPAEARRDGMRKASQLSPQEKKPSKNPVVSASIGRAPANEASLWISGKNFDQSVNPASLRERRAQKSGGKYKQLRLLEPPIFKRGYQKPMKNGELIRRLLTSDAPYDGSKSNPDKYYR